MNELYILPIISGLKSNSNLQDIWLIKENSTLLHLIKKTKNTQINPHPHISGDTVGYGRASE